MVTNEKLGEAGRWHPRPLLDIVFEFHKPFLTYGIPKVYTEEVLMSIEFSRQNPSSKTPPLNRPKLASALECVFGLVNNLIIARF